MKKIKIKKNVKYNHKKLLDNNKINKTKKVRIVVQKNKLKQMLIKIRLKRSKIMMNKKYNHRNLLFCKIKRLKMIFKMPFLKNQRNQQL